MRLVKEPLICAVKKEGKEERQNIDDLQPYLYNGKTNLLDRDQMFIGLNKRVDANS